MSQFEDELRRDFEKVVEEHSNLVGYCAAVALRVTVERSPVREGALRNNWRVGATELDAFEGSAELGGGEGSPPSSEQIASVDAAVRSAGRFASIWLGNPLEYASYVNDGTERQAAQPMLEPAIAAANAVVISPGESVPKR